MQMKSTTATVFRALALFVAMMAMNIGSATAAQPKPENTDQADSAAHADYAEEAQCMMVIVRLRTINPNRGAVATAMLGRLPPCEVRKYIRALPRR